MEKFIIYNHKNGLDEEDLKVIQKAVNGSNDDVKSKIINMYLDLADDLEDILVREGITILFMKNRKFKNKLKSLCSEEEFTELENEIKKFVESLTENGDTLLDRLKDQELFIKYLMHLYKMR